MSFCCCFDCGLSLQVLLVNIWLICYVKVFFEFKGVPVSPVKSLEWLGGGKDWGSIDVENDGDVLAGC